MNTNFSLQPLKPSLHKIDKEAGIAMGLLTRLGKHSKVSPEFFVVVLFARTNSHLQDHSYGQHVMFNVREHFPGLDVENHTLVRRPSESVKNWLQSVDCRQHWRDEHRTQYSASKRVLTNGIQPLSFSKLDQKNVDQTNIFFDCIPNPAHLLIYALQMRLACVVVGANSNRPSADSRSAATECSHPISRVTHGTERADCPPCSDCPRREGCDRDCTENSRRNLMQVRLHVGPLIVHLGKGILA